jgi:uncharacterized hydrophobic protein (TIGR00271 family)
LGAASPKSARETNRMAEADRPASRNSSGFLHWWNEQVVASVRHRVVVEQVHEDAGWSSHFAFMTLMSAGIAVLGLLLSSPAVVIGAMLISPLMGPIIGLGFALATFDSVEIRRSVRALAIGVILAVGFCALIVLVSPLQTVTDEIAARTRPNLFDLLVALFSGLAGTYAMIRGRHGTIVGVAIATALMPPLAVIGYGLATANVTVLAGSSLLFFTNLMTIAISAAVLARIYGFAPNLSPRQTRLQASLIIIVLLALALPLGFSLKQIAWEAVAARQAREAMNAYFGPEARLSQLDIDFDKEPIGISATVFSPRLQGKSEAEMSARLSDVLGRPVRLGIDHVRTENEDAEALQISAAKGSIVERSATRMAERLALVAGVAADDVLIDRGGKRAHVRAADLPGADMASYRALEARVAATEPGWAITLVPPAAALPRVEFEGEDPTAAGGNALETAAWAAKRLRLPIGVAAAPRGRAEKVRDALVEAGVQARIVPGGRNGAVELQWLMPGQGEP